MEKHKEYWQNMTAYLKDKVFKGDQEKFDAYVASSFKKAEPIMEHYSKQGNEFWLKSGDERAFYQTLEKTLLMPCETYEAEMKNLLGRDFSYNEIASNNATERNKKISALRKEALQAYKAKYPKEYSEFVKKQKELKMQKEQESAKELQKKINQ